jgi:hypothetical protein
MNSEDEKKFRALVAAFTHHEIDFGKLPKAPTDLLLKQILEAVETKVAQKGSE